MPDILVDTSVWIDHFRRGNAQLGELLALDRVVMHPLVLLELACGSLPAPRQRTLADLSRLRTALSATQSEMLSLIEQEQLHGQGCGAVDVALFAAVRLTPGTVLWTRDRRLAALAGRLGLLWSGRP
jgi:predicted nucleic acid-binding protein